MFLHLFCHHFSLVRPFYSVSYVRYRSHVVFASLGMFVTGSSKRNSKRRGIRIMVVRTHERTHPTKDPAERGSLDRLATSGIHLWFGNLHHV